jgi:uncharacterized damage-inducible protein DinB
MTKTYLLELANYNIWANDKLTNWLTQISSEQFEQPLMGSFKNIHETTLHIVAAEQIWHERLQNNVSEWLGLTFEGDKELMLKTWKRTSHDLKQCIQDLPEEKLMEKFAFSTRDGTPFNMERYKALAHVFNHSTFHRGQLVTLLRQVGFTGVSTTDLINYYREK